MRKIRRSYGDWPNAIGMPRLSSALALHTVTTLPQALVRNCAAHGANPIDEDRQNAWVAVAQLLLEPVSNP